VSIIITGMTSPDHYRKKKIGITIDRWVLRRLKQVNSSSSIMPNRLPSIPLLIKTILRSVEDTFTVPSSIFSKACWTPSPDTSLLILRLSACKMKIKNA